MIGAAFDIRVSACDLHVVVEIENFSSCIDEQPFVSPWVCRPVVPTRVSLAASHLCAHGSFSFPGQPPPIFQSRFAAAGRSHKRSAERTRISVVFSVVFYLYRCCRVYLKDKTNNTKTITTRIVILPCVLIVYRRLCRIYL